MKNQLSVIFFLVFGFTNLAQAGQYHSSDYPAVERQVKMSAEVQSLIRNDTCLQAAVVSAVSSSLALNVKTITLAKHYLRLQLAMIEFDQDQNVHWLAKVQPMADGTCLSDVANPLNNSDFVTR